ncbi:MAG: DUF2723 domain-containing protein [Spirochaetes bacterium]|nr:DUF2723 domain-containing protein [Spirochaetota bacterium]
MPSLTKKQKAYIKKNKDRSPEEIAKAIGVSASDVLNFLNTTNVKTDQKKEKLFPVTVDHIYKLTKTDYLIFLVLFAIALALYVYTMTPGIAAGDCGELTCAVYFLGGAHSPGYPLYCIVGKLFMWLFFPIGRIVFRLTFFSAFGGALTVGLAFLVFTKFLGRYHYKEKGDNLFFAKVPAIAAALFFLFSEELWAQATIAEVYTLNSLFLPMFFLVALHYEDRITQTPHLIKPDKTPLYHYNPASKLIYLFYFLFGVSAGDHHIILGYTVPFTLFFLYPHFSDKRFLRFLIALTLAYALTLIIVVYYNLPASFQNISKFIIFLVLVPYALAKIYEDNPRLFAVLAISGGFLALGLMVYLYMPIRSQANAPLDWGDPQTLERFITVVSRKQYRGFAQNIRSVGVFIQQAWTLIHWRLSQFTPWLYIFTFFGLYRLYKTNRKWFVFTLSFLFYYDLAFMQFNNFKFTPRDMFFAKVFFIPSYMVNIIWIAVGIEYVLSRLDRYVQTKTQSQVQLKKARIIMSVVLMLLAYLPFKANFDENNVRHAWANDNYGRNILKTVEYRSVLFTEGGDNQVFSLLYHNYVEYKRPDVNDPNAPNDSDKRGIFDQKGNVFLLYGDMMRMTPQQLFESQVKNDYDKLATGRPVFYTWKDYRRLNEINQRYNKHYEYIQTGILYRIKESGQVFTPPVRYWPYYDFAWEEHPDEAIYWDYLSREIIANYNFQQGDEFLADAYDAYNRSQNPSLSLKQRRDLKNKYFQFQDRAFYFYRRAKQFGFDMTAIHFNLGLLLEQQINIYRNEGDKKGINMLLDEAISNYLTAAEIENKQDNAPRAYFQAGRGFERKALFNEDQESDIMSNALRYYQIAFDLSPGYRDADMGVKRAGGFLRYPTKKIKEMETQIRKNPSQEKLYIDLVRAYIDRFQYNEAVGILEKGVNATGGSMNLLINLGNLYTQLNRVDEAIKTWSRILSRNPNEPNALFYLAENYFKKQRYKESFNLYQRFINVARTINNPQVQAMIQRAQQQIRAILPYISQ